MTDEALKQQLAYLQAKLDGMSETMHGIDKRLVVIETRAAVIGALAGLIVSVVAAILV